VTNSLRTRHLSCRELNFHDDVDDDDVDDDDVDDDDVNKEITPPTKEKRKEHKLCLGHKFFIVDWNESKRMWEFWLSLVSSIKIFH
jgi:hypothetical protein